MPYTTVLVTTPWGSFPSSIARQPRGCQYRNEIRLRKALGEMIPTPTFFSTDLRPTVEISSLENRPRGVWYTPSYTVVRASIGIATGTTFPTSENNILTTPILVCKKPDASYVCGSYSFFVFHPLGITGRTAHSDPMQADVSAGWGYV